VSRLFLVSALLFALLVAFALRSDQAHADVRLRGSPYVELDDADSSYRLRLVELVLVGGSAPRTDRFLDPSSEPHVPWPPLVHSALAFAAARTLERDASRAELEGFDELDLQVFASWIGPLFGAAAAVGRRARRLGAGRSTPASRGRSCCGAAVRDATRSRSRARSRDRCTRTRGSQFCASRSWPASRSRCARASRST
jgi:hypothetical protein